MKQFGEDGELDVDGFLNCCAELKASGALQIEESRLKAVREKMLARLGGDGDDGGGEEGGAAEDLAFMDAYPKAIRDTRHDHSLVLLVSISSSSSSYSRLRPLSLFLSFRFTSPYP